MPKSLWFLFLFSLFLFFVTPGKMSRKRLFYLTGAAQKVSASVVTMAPSS